ncbi:MAG TPA: hypothetical protein VJ731_08375 [Terriglobales bacterium]|jgi:hypothetical protein|nr:hypothetical protein [Terriglobales bacterium]
MRAKLLRLISIILALAVLVLGVVAYHLRATADNELPRVDLNTDNIGPRPIEDLTSKSVPRDYALAWQTMEQAVAENRLGLLDGYFTGLAKQDLTRRVSSQIKSGLRTRYTDRGHKLDAIFYSPAGDAMELRDHAQFDLQILDGSKVIYDEPVSAEYMVLMTPGADRWLVRELQATDGKKP